MRFLLTIIISICFLYCNSFSSHAQPKDVILQGFYWNSHPGDLNDNINGGIWWDSLSVISEHIADAGFKIVWVPSPSKGQAGKYDMGYGPYDYYDLGQYNQKGSLRSRFGKRAQLLNMINTMHAKGLEIMVDIVMNHRGGADAQQTFECGLLGNGWTLFSPMSNRFPGQADHFHPNNFHCDQNADFHNPLFFEDLCYFKDLDNVLDASAANSGWYFGPHALGKVGDSLVVYGRWLMEDIGFDHVRLDASKHMEPGFIAPWMVELIDGAQPFVAAEFFDGNPAVVKAYHDNVEFYNSSNGASKNADLAMLDFALRFKLADICGNTSGGVSLWDLNNAGLVFGGPMDPNDVMTFVDNHDFDRIGFRYAGNTPCASGEFQAGSSCLELFSDAGHFPINNDKHMAYSYILAAEGHPTVFWKDYFWRGMGQEINWLMNLRRSFAGGGSTPVSMLSPFFNGTWDGGDLFVLNRNGNMLENQPGCIYALNDRAAGSGEGSVWVNTPFTNMELKDYSDAFLFQSTEAFGDSRALIKAMSRNYSWYAPTGFYPKNELTDTSVFSLEPLPGTKMHYVALLVSNSSNYLVNGSPIQVGDQVAIVGPSGQLMQIAGQGRVGQRLTWEGTHDMIIEVLGGANSGQANGGLINGDLLRLVIYDADQLSLIEADQIAYLASGSNFTFNPDRPASRGGSFTITNNNNSGTFAVGGISVISSFSTPISCGIPFNANSIAVSSNGVILDWETIPGTQGYELRGKPLNAANWITFTLPGSGNSFKQVSGLNPNTFYIWQVRSICDQANSVFSAYTELDTFRIRDMLTCDVPTPISTTNIGSTSASLNWSTSPYAVKYEIKGRKIGATAVSTIKINAPANSKTVSGLQSGTAYEWQVRALCSKDANWASDFTALTSFTTSSSKSMKDINSEKMFPISLYPNPANDRITIFSSSISGNSFNGSIRDISGRIVIQITGLVDPNGKKEIDVRHLKPGIYFLETAGSFAPPFKFVIH